MRAVALGLAITLPYALLNAYGLKRSYTLANDVPDLPIVAVGVVAGLVVARALRPVATRAGPWFADRTNQRRIGTVLAVGLLLVLGLFRERARFLGEAYSDMFGPEPVRSLDELNLHRLSLYLTRYVWPLAVVGLAVVGRQRWRAARWIVLVPGLCMLPLYLWEAQVAPRLMWWVRRFVPSVVPVIVLLVAVALGWCLTQRRWLLRGVGALALIGLVVSYVDRSWPLHDHREMGGSYAMAEEIAGAAGDRQGVFLWEAPVPGVLLAPNRNLPAVVWLGFGELAAYLPADPTQSVVDQYAARFPDQPLFVVSGSEELPGDLDPGSFERVDHVEAVLPVWEEANFVLPDGPTALPQELTVWRFDGSRGDRGS